MFTHKDDTPDDVSSNQTGPVDLSPSDNILQDIVEGDAEVLQNLPDEPVVQPVPESISESSDQSQESSEQENI